MLIQKVWSEHWYNMHSKAISDTSYQFLQHHITLHRIQIPLGWMPDSFCSIDSLYSCFLAIQIFSNADFSGFAIVATKSLRWTFIQRNVWIISIVHPAAWHYLESNAELSLSTECNSQALKDFTQNAWFAFSLFEFSSGSAFSR